MQSNSTTVSGFTGTVPAAPLQILQPPTLSADLEDRIVAVLSTCSFDNDARITALKDLVQEEVDRNVGKVAEELKHAWGLE